MIQELFSLKGKTAIITGGANGIGRCYVEAFADMGANVVIADIDENKAKKVSEEIISKYGVKSIYTITDVTSKQDVDKMINTVEDVFDKIDVLVNNAGIAHLDKVEEVSYEDYKKVIDVNLNGVFLCAQAVGKSMIDKDIKGSIINIGSMSAHIINIPQKIASYEASKAGVVHLTKAFAVEWAKHGIRVNSISPGYVKTELVAEMKEMHEIWEEKIPMMRMAKPEEIAPLAVYLASDASSYVTGSDMIIDGGYTCI